jgi:hypothetical protein
MIKSGISYIGSSLEGRFWAGIRLKRQKNGKKRF